MLLRLKVVLLLGFYGNFFALRATNGNRLHGVVVGKERKEVASVDDSQQVTALQEASQLLASVNVYGLCHPSSDRFTPLFPQCETTSLPPKPRRQLQQNNDNNNNMRYYQYYYEADDDTERDSYVDYWAGTDNDLDNNNNINSVHHTTIFYIMNAVLTLLCVLVGSLSTGMYVGLLSLDPLLLVVKSRTTKSEAEKRRIETLLAIMKQRHQLVATLVVTSCLAAEAMPVFLQRLVHDYLAILVSAALVLLFGEIFPSMVFTGVNQLDLASRYAPALRLWIWLLYPVVYPIARILEILSSKGRDSLSSSGELGGVGGTLYNRGELAALIRIQYEERRQRRKLQKQHSRESLRQQLVDEDDFQQQQLNYPLDNNHAVVSSSVPSVTSPTSSMDLRLNKRRDFQRRASMSSIDSHDVDMIEGALQLKTKTAMEICQSWHKVFCIPHDMILDETNIFTIYASGYSRVPVYVNGDRRQVLGILLSRQLMVVNNSKKKGQSQSPPTPLELSLHTPRCVRPDTNLADLISLFQSGSSALQAGHMALVCSKPTIGNKALETGQAIPEKAGLMGVCTLEDVLEALLQQQIYDEMDAAGRSNSRPPLPLLPPSSPVVEGMATIQEADSYQQIT